MDNSEIMARKFNITCGVHWKPTYVRTTMAVQEIFLSPSELEDARKSSFGDSTYRFLFDS